jgi:flagellar basal-body rod protein FlgC
MINILSGINSSSAALNAERIRLEIIAQNIANANTTRGVDGLPYQRQQVVFESVLSLKQGLASPAGTEPQTVQVARIQKDNRPPRLVYNPGHPDADAQGMVAAPDINVYEEMADLLTATRAYEANLAVVKNARAMAQQTLNIGKR